MDIWTLLIWVMRLANVGLAVTALTYNTRFFFKLRPYKEHQLSTILLFHIVADCYLVGLSIYLIFRMVQVGPPMMASIVDDIARIGTLLAYTSLAIEAALREYPWTAKSSQ